MKLSSFAQLLALAPIFSHNSIIASAQPEPAPLINLSVFSTLSCRGVQLVYLDIPPGECLASLDDPYWGRSINIWGTTIDDGGAWGYVTGWKNEDCTVQQYQHSTTATCLADIQEEKRAVSYSWTYTGPLTLDMQKIKKKCIGPHFLQYFDQNSGVIRRISVKGLEHGELKGFIRRLTQMENNKEFYELMKYVESGCQKPLFVPFTH